jgi:hypothetical protein
LYIKLELLLGPTKLKHITITSVRILYFMENKTEKN